MKKLLITALLLTATLFATNVAPIDDSNFIIKNSDFVSKTTANFSKKDANAKKIAYVEGFLTSKECAQQGLFKDCNLDSFERSDMVLFIHDENKLYSFKMTNDIKLAIYDNAINTNKVKIFGKIDQKKSLITIAGLSVATPPKKEFFKGCL